jgi:hypothetical protein
MPKRAHHELGNAEWLKARITEGLSQPTIAAQAGVTPGLVAYYVKKHGLQTGLEKSARTKAAIARKYPNGRKGPLAGNWQGGRMSTTGRKPGGYVRLYMPDHPQASGGYVYEHRWVMEQKIGRPVLPTEVVDHIDRNRSNNHPDNLRLHTTRAAHVKDHFAARDQLVALVGKIRAVKRWPECCGDGPGDTIVAAADLDALCDEAMAGLENL